MSGKKGSNIEVADRVSKVYMLLLNGLKRREIIQYAAKNEWDLTDRQIDEYIRRATDIFKAAALENMEYARNMSLNRHDDLYFKSMKINDFKTCLAVQKSRDEITGVRSNKLELSGKDGSPIIHQFQLVKGVTPPKDESTDTDN